MKRIITFVTAALAAVSILSSCGTSLAPSEYSDEYSAADVVMQSQFPVYSSDFDEIQISLLNNTVAALEFGSQYVLETKVDGKWSKIPFVENAGFNALLYILNDGGTHTFDVSRNMFDYDFPHGKYRVVKELNNGSIIAFVEFEIGESKITAQTPYGYVSIDSLPKDYSFAMGVSDGCVGIGAMTDNDALIIDAFFSDYFRGVDSQIRFCEKTDEGLVITDILYERVIGDRIKYTVDSTRAGGEVISDYFSNIVTDGVKLFLSNHSSYSEYDGGFDFIIDSVDWSGRDGALKMIENNGTDEREWSMDSAVFWSKDGKRNIQFIMNEPLSFGVSRIYDGGGNSSSMQTLKGKVGLSDAKLTYAEWQSDGKTVTLFWEDSKGNTGYVLYDTDEYSVKESC